MYSLGESLRLTWFAVTGFCCQGAGNGKLRKVLCSSCQKRLGLSPAHRRKKKILLREVGGEGVHEEKLEGKEDIFISQVGNRLKVFSEGRSADLDAEAFRGGGGTSKFPDRVFYSTESGVGLEGTATEG